MSFRAKRLFKGEATAGLSLDDWTAATPLEKMRAKLRFIHDRASPLAGTFWDESMGVPPNVPGDAESLCEVCGAALDALDKDQAAGALLAMDAAKRAAELNEWIVIAKALDLHNTITKPKAAGGKATAEARRAEAETRAEAAAALWHRFSDRPERDRASLIAARMGIPADTVRRYLKKAGLR